LKFEERKTKLTKPDT